MAGGLSVTGVSRRTEKAVRRQCAPRGVRARRGHGEPGGAHHSVPCRLALKPHLATTPHVSPGGRPHAVPGLGPGPSAQNTGVRPCSSGGGAGPAVLDPRSTPKTLCSPNRAPGHSRGGAGRQMSPLPARLGDSAQENLCGARLVSLSCKDPCVTRTHAKTTCVSPHQGSPADHESPRGWVTPPAVMGWAVGTCTGASGQTH